VPPSQKATEFDAKRGGIVGVPVWRHPLWYRPHKFRTDFRDSVTSSNTGGALSRGGIGVKRQCRSAYLFGLFTRIPKSRYFSGYEPVAGLIMRQQSYCGRIKPSPSLRRINLQFDYTPDRLQQNLGRANRVTSVRLPALIWWPLSEIRVTKRLQCRLKTQKGR
jgi:hypothetical protein